MKKRFCTWLPNSSARPRLLLTFANHRFYRQVYIHTYSPTQPPPFLSVCIYPRVNHVTRENRDQGIGLNGSA